MYDIGINAKRVNSFYYVKSIEIVTKIATQLLGSFTQKNRKKKRSNKNIVLHHIYQNFEGNRDIPIQVCKPTRHREFYQVPFKSLNYFFKIKLG